LSSHRRFLALRPRPPKRAAFEFRFLDGFECASWHEGFISATNPKINPRSVRYFETVTNGCLILSQRIMDLFEQSGMSLAEQEASLEVTRVIVRQLIDSTCSPILTDEPDAEDRQPLS